MGRKKEKVLDMVSGYGMFRMPDRVK